MVHDICEGDWVCTPECIKLPRFLAIIILSEMSTLYSVTQFLTPIEFEWECAREVITHVQLLVTEVNKSGFLGGQSAAFVAVIFHPVAKCGSQLRYLHTAQKSLLFILLISSPARVTR